MRVIDLSADFRLATPEAYKRWYGHDHPAPELLPAPYGLPELNRAALRDAALIANPGCYPTGALLGLAPLLRAGALADGDHDDHRGNADDDAHADAFSVQALALLNG